jgi:hypothetical protein
MREFSVKQVGQIILGLRLDWMSSSKGNDSIPEIVYHDLTSHAQDPTEIYNRKKYSALPSSYSICILGLPPAGLLGSFFGTST